MNLLAPVSPHGWSQIVPELPLGGNGQIYEGFQYLGLGILLLMALAAVVTWRGRGAARDRLGDVASLSPPLWTPAMVGMCLLMMAFAISPKVTVGSHVLADLGLVWAVATVATRLSRGAAIVAMTAGVVVQLADLNAAHLDRRRTAHGSEFYAWTNPLASDLWATIAPAYAHLALVPPPQCGAAPLPYAPVMRLASRHGLSVNAGVIARGDDGARERYCTELAGAIDAAALRSDTLYLVSAPEADGLRRVGNDRVVCGEVDAVWICTTREAHARWRDRAPFDRVPDR
jgi:hypothetical protein